MHVIPTAVQLSRKHVRLWQLFQLFKIWNKLQRINRTDLFICRQMEIWKHLQVLLTKLCY